MDRSQIINRIRRWCIKTFIWEYWPSWAIYLPVSFYYIYLSIKAKSFFFFSASNPSIETWDMFFESKWKIFQLVPKEYYPATILVSNSEDIDRIQHRMDASGIIFPIIAKPDKGEGAEPLKKL